MTPRNPSLIFTLARLRGIVLAFALVLGLTSCQKPPLTQQMAFVFGTMVEVSVWGEDPARGRELCAKVFAEFDRLHRLLHPWQPGPMADLNAAIAAGKQNVATDPEIARMIEAASAASVKSEHLFNPAIGKLVALWGFHTDTPPKLIPPAPELEAIVKAQPRMTDLVVEGDRVTSRNRQVQLDFGGYAKGYALDRAEQLLRAEGVKSALINIGGNVLAIGSKGSEPWRIGIQDPRRPSSIATLELHDGEAIGTSGDYQRYFELDGKRYSHLIDPRSGEPVQGMASVTVLYAKQPGAGTLSDWTSKPLFVAGADGWQEAARKIGVTQTLVITTQKKAYASAAMRARLTWDETKNGPLTVLP
jgi:thiamine biosynthesis lipoprotein